MSAGARRIRVRAVRRGRRRALARAATAGRRRAAAVALALAAALAVPGCIMFEDRVGVSIDRELLARCVPGETTRAEVLELLGPPTGYHSTDLLAVVTRFATPLGPPRDATRLDDDVYAYQLIDVRARAAFFPVLFVWVGADFTSRTALVLFDERGVVRDVAWREDRS